MTMPTILTMAPVTALAVAAMVDEVPSSLYSGHCRQTVLGGLKMDIDWKSACTMRYYCIVLFIYTQHNISIYFRTQSAI